MTGEPLVQTGAADELGILARRRIEAAIIAPIYAELRAEIGETRAKALIARAIRQAAIEAGKDFAGKTPGGVNLETFQDIQRLWTKDDALRIETLKATSEVFEFNVRRCRYAESYKAMGLADIGPLLSSNSKSRHFAVVHGLSGFFTSSGGIVDVVMDWRMTSQEGKTT